MKLTIGITTHEPSWAWAPAEGGGTRVGKLGKTFFPLYGGPFYYIFSIWETFRYVVLVMGGLFHDVRALFLLFSPCEGSFCPYGEPLGTCPRPTKISAGAHAPGNQLEPKLLK